jgi:hypothetical protein
LFVSLFDRRQPWRVTRPGRNEADFKKRARVVFSETVKQMEIPTLPLVPKLENF